MKMRGGSFGLLALLVVLVVVLLLVAQNWQKIAPTAHPTGASHGETEAKEEVASGGLPDLEQTQQTTDAHANALEAALEESE